MNINRHGLIRNIPSLDFHKNFTIINIKNSTLYVVPIFNKSCVPTNTATSSVIPVHVVISQLTIYSKRYENKSPRYEEQPYTAISSVWRNNDSSGVFLVSTARPTTSAMTQHMHISLTRKLVYFAIFLWKMSQYDESPKDIK